MTSAGHPPSRPSGRQLAAQRTLASGLLVQAWSGRQAPLTLRQSIDALRVRISEVEAECEARRVTGPKEKYLEAVCLAEVFTMQLESCLRHLDAEVPAP